MCCRYCTSFFFSLISHRPSLTGSTDCTPSLCAWPDAARQAAIRVQRLVRVHLKWLRDRRRRAEAEARERRVPNPFR